MNKPSMTHLTHLRAETLDNPLGIDARPPRLSWQMRSERPGAKQVAYQIIATGGEGEGWDSGQIESAQSVNIPYGGALHSRDRVEWRVRVWDETGARAESDPATFEMGLLNQTDWRARWVSGSLSGGVWTSVPCPYLRKAFAIQTAAVARARLYITALGVYEARLNGQRVSADHFNPGWTDYHQRNHYHTYDVTALLRPGANALGAILGDGWYCGHVDWRGRQRYGDRPALLAQLEIIYADGSAQTIISDETWAHNYGPLLASDLLMGEAYDARQEFLGWDEPGFDDSRWSAALLNPPPPARLEAYRANPVRATEELHPLALTHIDDWPVHRWVFDLGQNMVGRVRLKARGKAGQTFTLRHAEALIADPPLSPNGTLYSVALRTAKATDHYTCQSEGEEIWEPRFTFHGFRYVEVTGCDPQPPLDTVTGVVLHSDLPFTGRFECSEPLLNRLQKNIQWSQRGNFLSLPTDCPQRDERLGWTGDILAFAPAAAFNMDVSAFLADWSRELALAQWADGAVPPVAPDVKVTPDEGGPAWADALIGVPWALYQTYGDKTLLAELYPACEKFMAWLEANSPGGLRAATGWQGFGDWLSFSETPKTLIGTAHYAHSADVMARMAEALGQSADAAKYRARFEQVRAVFNERFVLPNGLLLNNTQTGYALALAFNLLPAEWRAAAVGHLAQAIRANGTKLTTGFVGTPHLLFALSDNGQLDLAYALLLQKEFPSWLYPVTQGATTIWERWDGWRHDRGFQNWMMNSFNHYANGAVGQWLYQVVGGIRPHPEQPGFQHFILAPQAGGGLTFARAEYDSAYGKIISHWKIEDGAFVWNFVIPANASATVILGERHARYEAGAHEIKIK